MKHLLNLALVFIALSAAAQSNYQSGYIVKNNNDTLRGFINSKDLQTTTQYVQFKKTKDGSDITRYTPTEIKVCYIAPFYTYLSYTGKLSNNKNLYPDIDNIKDTTTSYGSIFLQKIANGPNVALYMNTDDRKTRFFLKEKYSAPIELLYYEYGSPAATPKKDSPYLGPLIEAFSKYNGMNSNKISDLQRTEFTQSSLEDAVTVINKGIKDKNVPGNNNRFFIGLSVGSVNSTVSNLLNTAATSATATATSISPTIKVGLDLLNNSGMQKLLFRSELSFSYLKPKYIFSYSPNGGLNTIDNNTYDVSRYMVSFTPQLIYNIFNAPNLIFFVGAGASINYSIIPNNEIDYYSIVSFGPYTLKQYTTPGIKSPLTFGLPLQTGIILNKHIQLMINYLPPITISTDGKRTFKYQSVGAGINYLFDSK